MSTGAVTHLDVTGKGRAVLLMMGITSLDLMEGTNEYIKLTIPVTCGAEKLVPIPLVYALSLLAVVVPESEVDLI